MMVIDSNYEIGDVVYLKTDVEQMPRIVTGILIRESTTVYYLSCVTSETTHYNCEISKDVDIVLKTNN